MEIRCKSHYFIRIICRCREGQKLHGLGAKQSETFQNTNSRDYGNPNENFWKLTFKLYSLKVFSLFRMVSAITERGKHRQQITSKRGYLCLLNNNLQSENDLRVEMNNMTPLSLSWVPKWVFSMSSLQSLPRKLTKDVLHPGFHICSAPSP